MKKNIVILLILLVHVAIMAQTSSGIWNNSTVTYSNTKLGITWTLIEDLDWVERPILVKNTLFKVRNEDTYIVVNLGCEKYDGKGGNAWDYLSYYSTKEYINLIKAEAQRNGMEFQYVKPVRSQLCGLHANKVVYDMTRHLPEYNVTVHTVNYMYQIAANNHIYTLNVRCLLVGEDDLDAYERIVSQIINGFRIKEN